ncbi:MAG TPA: hypothetical protein VGG99_12485 [Acetobacteraceae bacterium]|jgi:hypothetical protein
MRKFFFAALAVLSLGIVSVGSAYAAQQTVYHNGVEFSGPPANNELAGG